MARKLERLRWQASRLAQKILCPDCLTIFGYLAEDLIAARLLESHKRTGYYVDVGCSDPVALSNTLLLHRRGWRGVNVDANPQVIESFRRARPDDRNVCALVGCPGAAREFVIFEDATRATASGEFRQRWEGEHRIREVLRLAPRTLTGILEEVEAPARMEFLNIDVEGLELEVLESLDCKKYRFELVAAEIHDLRLSAASADPVVAYLASHDYRLVAYNGLTAFFLSSEAGGLAGAGAFPRAEFGSGEPPR